MKHTMIPCPTEQAQVIDAPICRTLRNNLVSPDAAQPGDLVAIERVMRASEETASSGTFFRYWRLDQNCLYEPDSFSTLPSKMRAPAGIAVAHLLENTGDTRSIFPILTSMRKGLGDGWFGAVHFTSGVLLYDISFIRKNCFTDPDKEKDLSKLKLVVLPHKSQHDRLQILQESGALLEGFTAWLIRRQLTEKDDRLVPDTF